MVKIAETARAGRYISWREGFRVQRTRSRSGVKLPLFISRAALSILQLPKWEGSLKFSSDPTSNPITDYPP
jgi:hypothetical protein